MLDSNTKRNIDAARNVLVGKVPDPKAQVEQITTALIYKFMDDLDKESIEMGGKAKFFTDDYEKYSWAKLIDTRQTGEGRLDLYVQAISSMTRNRNLPQLFRDIFKSAFLPYNDPQTLSLFLKEINKFTYDHSEELGNAFEYLLSVLGSQGDAGQFRTPRHIIDFMVEVIEPKKSDTILDPACGTAGFLISAFKHIRKHNSSNYKAEQDAEEIEGETAAEMILQEKEIYKGDKLTPTERKKLTQNIEGYDISPDMVRLSLVNLYLHGFTSPKIYEYDTLTSEKRWGETFDVILANPPFMTPKGGIRPHKRFQVQAKRSEVLFVDYILEHLNINGRAGIIVPEGVIFKSERAYKGLRQLMVDDGLFAVVSLPPGVFNPYSGVKTSILLFDNQVAAKVDEILFIQIENDGFGLGAQRQKIKENDLPMALKILQAWKQGEKRENKMALWVKKEKIAEDGDYNLTGEKYREGEFFKNQTWPLVKLGDISDTSSGGTPLKSKGEYYDGGKIPWLRSGEVSQGEVYISELFITELGLKESSAKIFPINTVLVAMYGATAGQVGILKFPSSTNQAICGISPNEKMLPKFLYYFLKTRTKYMVQISSGGAQPNISQKIIRNQEIPLPPLEVQKDIVAQIEVKQAAIEGAKAVIENLERERRYFGNGLRKIDGIEWVELGEVCHEILSGGTPSTKIEEYWNGGIPWITSADIVDIQSAKPRKFISKKAITESATNLIPGDNIIVVTRVGLGKLFHNDFDVCISQDAQGLIVNKDLAIPNFLVRILLSEVQKFKDVSQGSTIQGVTKKQLKKLSIPLPTKEIQRDFVVKAEEEDEIIAANYKLIELMEKKIEQVLEEI